MLDDEQLTRIRRQQLTGVAGVGAMRIARALGISRDEDGARRLLAIHPLLNPAAYVDTGLAHEDGAWISLCDAEWTDALGAIVQALDPYLDVEIGDDARAVTVVRRSEPAPELKEVAVTRFSTGTDFAFESRTSLPITPV